MTQCIFHEDDNTGSRNKDLDLETTVKWPVQQLSLVSSSSLFALHHSYGESIPLHFPYGKCIFFLGSQNVWEMLTHLEWYGSFCSFYVFMKPILYISF
jgi:hypothetical protein